jgi:7,8-dihydropterin-6-yl-methyl-4-(beta-D-ribofuranosyl)aminobenzene 5'-phosphate synthase
MVLHFGNKKFPRGCALLLALGLVLLFCACYRQSDFSQATITPGLAAYSSTVVFKTKTVPGNTIHRIVLTPTTTVIPTVTEVMKEEKILPTTMPIKITIVYDNTAYDQRLKSVWGFSALVEYNDQSLLFDTGGDGQILIENMQILGIDPALIERVVLSHAHGDHTGGLSAILASGARPVVYLLPSFSNVFKQRVAEITEVIEVTPGLSIAQNMYTTGEMRHGVPEQALVIQSDQGLVIITGCAHPGIVEIVDRSRTLFDDRVRLVMGGFHLGSKSEAEIEAILEDFRRLGVEQVAPCHCTGEGAMAMFAAEYGEDYIQAGVGREIILNGGDN